VNFSKDYALSALSTILKKTFISFFRISSDLQSPRNGPGGQTIATGGGPRCMYSIVACELIDIPTYEPLLKFPLVAIA